MERMNRPCRQEQTGSCYGCPVIGTVYEAAKDAAIWRPRSLSSDILQAADKAALERCPEGLRPQTELIGRRAYGRDLSGHTVQVYLKRP